MRTLRMLALLTCGLVVVAHARAADWHIGIGVGGPAYVVHEPACPYGYYESYPYDCVPYGYYGPEWFTGGVFIGAGPWYHHHRGNWGRGWDHDWDRGRY